MIDAEPIHLGLPFDPDENPILICQGNHGPDSHLEWPPRQCNGGVDDWSYAVDFALPVGTEVRAACSGEVRHSFTGDSRYSTTPHRAVFEDSMGAVITNQVMIYDTDRQVAVTHSHLMQKSSLVRRGDHVEKGQPIARTGLSGWIGPISHLHMEACRRERLKGADRDNQTLPMVFEGYDGPLDHKKVIAEMRRNGKRFEEVFAHLMID